MRKAIAAVPVVAILLMGACASTSTGPNRYQVELQQLAADCTARGGILSRTGDQSGRPQLDNVCKITAMPSGLIRN